MYFSTRFTAEHRQAISRLRKWQKKETRARRKVDKLQRQVSRHESKARQVEFARQQRNKTA